MKRCLVLFCLAAFVLFRPLHTASASRALEPLQVTGSSVLFSKSTGQTVLFATLILPHADSLAGTTVTVNIGTASVTFTLDARGNARSLNSKVAVRLGQPTCSCQDASHLARLSLTVKGTRRQRSVLAAADDNMPQNASVHFGYLSDAIDFDTPLTLRR
jgi:hypothetical protein